ncbi:conserved exported hypothetical protein [Candidatus Sulfopaludibacter sp. SbA4]|nr:conserved exported hypothetical protein [Candidatus Sulfopaludibacter sp. SbA4]
MERLRDVSNRFIWVISLLSAATAAAAYDDYASAKRKVDQIEAGQLRAGTRLELSAPELNAYIAREAPDGVRNPKIQLVAPGVASGTALVDFSKLQHAQGRQPGWLMTKLLEGERPVSVTARIRSAGGRATVDVDKVEISGVEIDGRTLDFLIQNVVLPQYPDVMVGRPFELGYRINKLDVRPTAVGIVIGR